jgi:hypothetical protein
MEFNDIFFLWSARHVLNSYLAQAYKDLISIHIKLTICYPQINQATYAFPNPSFVHVDTSLDKPRLAG